MRFVALLIVFVVLAFQFGVPVVGLAAEPYPPPLNNTWQTDTGTDVNPDVAMSSSGTGITVWQTRIAGSLNWEILAARSTNYGLTWEDPVQLSTELFGEEHPAIATDDAGTWIVVWDAHEHLGLLVSRSSDDGQTWTHPVELATNASGEFNQTPTIATDQNGSWVVAWTSSNPFDDPADNDNDILVSRSSDNGLSWSPAAPLNSTHDIGVAFDASPSVATDGSGQWVAAWGSSDPLGGGSEGDIVYARSIDDGASWSAVADLNPDAASDSLVDSGPSIAAASDGTFVVTWTRADFGTRIVVSRSVDTQTWSFPTQLSSVPSGSPDLATDRQNRWVVAWQQASVGPDDFRDLGFVFSSDGGMTWSPVSILNGDGVADGIEEGQVTLALSGPRLVGVWHGQSTTIGSPFFDHDLFYTTCSPFLNDVDCDSIVDNEDACPDMYSPPPTNGCPPSGPPAVGGTAGLLDASRSSRSTFPLLPLAGVVLVALSAMGYVRRRL